MHPMLPPRRLLVALLLVAGTRARRSCRWDGDDSPVDTAHAARVLADFAVANDLPPRPAARRVAGAAVGDAERGRRWFGDVMGVRMLVSTLPAAAASRLPALADFLRASEPRWRGLADDPEWPKAERSQVTSKYRRYNALAEAVHSQNATVARAGRELKKALGARLAELMARYAAADPPCDPARRRRLKVVDPNFLGAGRPSHAPAVEVQSWLNAHRANLPGEDSLSVHTHHFSWHGYLLLDAAGTNTTYHPPPPEPGAPRPLFNLGNSDGVLVLLCGGVEHAVPPVAASERPRLSMAFDFAFSFDYGGRAVAHPGAEFGWTGGARELASDGVRNSWANLLSAGELRAALGGDAPTAYDWRAVQADAERAGDSFWAGVVDVAGLLRDGGGDL